MSTVQPFRMAGKANQPTISLGHGHRVVVPPRLPVGTTLRITALGPGWCELTTGEVPFSIFGDLHVTSRHRLLLPHSLRPWWGQLEHDAVLCIVRDPRKWPVELLIVNTGHLISAFAHTSYRPPRVHRWTPDSPWAATGPDAGAIPLLRSDSTTRPPHTRAE